MKILLLIILPLLILFYICIPVAEILSEGVSAESIQSTGNVIEDEGLIKLPTIETLTPTVENKGTSSPETVAGTGDEVAKPKIENTQNPVFKPTVNTTQESDAPAPGVVVAQEPRAVTPEPSLQVLGAEDSIVAESDTSAEGVNSVIVEPQTYKNRNHVLDYIAAAAFALLLLIGLIYQLNRTHRFN